MRVYESARELRIACKHDDLLPSLSEYDPRRETREIECGIPVKRFCRGTEKYGEEVLAHIEDGVDTWRILQSFVLSMWMQQKSLFASLDGRCSLMFK